MNKQKLNSLWQLLASFVKVGSFMFGGGYAMLPLLERELIENRKWITQEELLDVLSLSQMTPGTIAINAATHIGSKQAGIIGGLVASFGIVLPSLLIVTIIYQFFGQDFENEYVQKAFFGIRACLVALIGHSLYKMFKTGVKGMFAYAIFAIAFVLLLLGLNPILVILFAGISGIAIGVLMPKNKFINKNL